MKNLIFTLLILFYCSSALAEQALFLDIPKGLKTSLGLPSVKLAAQHRKWTIIVDRENELIIYLDHRCFQSKLTFTLKDHSIMYQDDTRVLQRCRYPSSYSLSEPDYKQTNVPSNWLENLKSDTSRYFSTVKLNNTGRHETSTDSKEGITKDQLEEKLKQLKSLYDKKLISEQEYNDKKKELLERF